jgi:hypothetical protein
MPRNPIDRDANGDPGGSLPKNVMKLKSIAKREGIDCGEAKTGPEFQAAIIAGRTAKAEPPVEGQDVLADTPPGLEEIENIVKGSTLHLGDGRKIAFGESAPVGAELARALRDSGQAK